jgi:carbon-monoxide dehydrogenase medium subunit
MSLNSHPTLPEFDYIRPETPLEASQFLVQHEGEACPFLGGTDIFVRMRDGFQHPRFLVDVKWLGGMRELNFDPESGLTIGAAVNMNQIAKAPEVRLHYPLLAEACQSVASYQLRNRATVAGNICNASPAGDTIGACMVFNGALHIHGVNGMRQESLKTFFLGPGKNTLKCGDIVTAVHLPLPPPGAKGKYLKLGRNKLSDLSIVAVTVLGWPDHNQSSGYRIRAALTSVAPTPLLLENVKGFLSSHKISPETIDEAAQMAAESCSPIDDVRATARYRRQMVKRLSIRALTDVWKSLNNQAGNSYETTYN